MVRKECPMTDRERVEALLRREKPDRLPIYPFSIAFSTAYHKSDIAAAFKDDMKKYLAYLIKTVERKPIDLNLSIEATADIIKEKQPDALILAVGAEPDIPDMPGVDTSMTVLASDVFKGKELSGQNILVAGGGLTGCEAALLLAQLGKKVTIVEMLGEIASNATVLNKLGLFGLLHQNGVQIRTAVKLETATDQGAFVIDKNWNRYHIGVDAVVLATGYKARSDTVKAFQSFVPEVYVVGDCAQPRNLMAAIHDGFNVAAEL